MHQLGAHPGGPEVLDGRDELPVAESVGPGVQALGDVLPRQLVENRGGLGAEHERDGVDGQLVGKRDRNQLEAELAEDLELFALVGRPARYLDVADLDAIEGDLGRPVEGLVDGG